MSTTTSRGRTPVPRDPANDYTPSAIVAEEWVKAHDAYGRNRP